VRPRLLLLYHQLFWGRAPAALVEEVTSSYDGTVISAKDLDLFDIAT